MRTLKIKSMQRPRSTQRQRLGATRALLLGLAIPVFLALAGAATSSTIQRPVYQAPQSYYLALGDSITYGFQPTKAKAGARPSAFRTGFVDVFAARLRKLAPGIQVVNYGCPGESTVTFMRGGCPAFTDGIELHDAFRGSQLKAALSFLRAQPEAVSPITVTLYGNDWLPVLLDTCKGNATCARKHAPSATGAFASRLRSILQQLRKAAPDAEIIVTGAWNPDPNQLRQLGDVYRSLEASIARAAAVSGARVARMVPVFNPSGSLPARKAKLCALTFICSKGDPHPTNAGYRAMADAHMAASGYPRKS
jgi:lysophospholipase L1-like esterase